MELSGFCEKVRSELAVAKAPQACCRAAEVRAFLEAWGAESSRRLSLRVDFAPAARRLYGLLRDLDAPGIKVTRRPAGGFVVSGRVPDGLIPPAAYLPAARCCRRSYLRALFVARGFVSVTAHGYHWEVKSAGRDQAERVGELLAALGLSGARVGRWQGGWATYLKEAERISAWLRLVGAHEALLEFESLRVAREMRNKVNRRVNYETANLARTAVAALRQKEDIRLIERTSGLGSLPPSLRVLAEARLTQPLASLAELARVLTPPLSKSGAGHRMRRIAAAAERIRREQARRQPSL